MEIKTMEGKIKKLMENEDRKDAEFRCLITLTELGDIGKYITHDPELNPGARPHGTKEDEILAYGQTIVQLIALTYLRNISTEKAIEIGIKNWEEADWRKKGVKDIEKIIGLTACYGMVTGEAYVVNKDNKIDDFKNGCILVAEFAKPDLVNYLEIASAIVTDHGGKTSHVATIAREKNVVCVVGTGNATKKIKHGGIIIVDARKDTGEIYIK